MMRYIYLVACFALLLILPYQSNASQPPSPVPSPAFWLSAQAGLAAYFYTPEPLDLDYIRPLFFAVDYETDEYLWGRYALAGRTEQLRMLVTRSGLVLVAHEAGVHVGQLFDCGWGITVTTSQLSKAIKEVSDALRQEPEYLYFDFRNPTATGLTRAWHYQNSGGTHSYNVFLPLENSYLDRGFYVCSVTKSYLTVNNETVFSVGWPSSNQIRMGHGVLSGQQLRAGQENNLTMSGEFVLARGFLTGVGVVYEGSEPVEVTEGNSLTWSLVYPDEVGELVKVYRLALPFVGNGNKD